MSFNRENVIWQSPDGTWNRGFFEVFTSSSYDDDYDPEWDVEYGEGFEWVSAGHRTKQDAERSWRGANPGGHTVYEYGDGTKDDIAGFELQAALAHRARRNYHGPAKQVPIVWLAEQVADANTHDVAHELRGYANRTTADREALARELGDRLTSATADEVRAASGVFKAAAQKLEDAIGAVPRPRDRWSRPYPAAAVAAAREVVGELDQLTERITQRGAAAAAPSAGVKSDPAPARRKTTEASTPGSFAPKFHSFPEIHLNIGALE